MVGGREGGREWETERRNSDGKAARGIQVADLNSTNVITSLIQALGNVYTCKKKSKQLRFREETRADSQSAAPRAHPSPRRRRR